MIGITVTLKSYEICQAAIIGLMRHAKSVEKRLEHAHGFNGDQEWDKHIEGALGELAVAKVLDVYWQGSIGTFKDGGDVGDYQVRTSIERKGKRDYSLIIRPDDPDNSIFILVVGRVPTYRVVGWIRAREAKKHQEWWDLIKNDRPPAWTVPEQDLYPIDALKSLDTASLLC